MRRKAILLATVAGTALAFVEPALAAPTGMYFSVSGGANFMQSEDGSFSTFRNTTVVEHIDPKTGFLISSAVGLELENWLHGFKVELEASYRRNELGGHWEATRSELNLSSVGAQAFASGGVEGHSSTFALMANAWYEFNIGTRFKPYFGGGVGWAKSKTDGALEDNLVSLTAAAVNPFGGFSAESSGFAYQLGAGITSEIMPGVSLGIGYRYFDAPNTELFFGGKLIGNGIGAAALSDGEIKFDNVSHSVALTLTVDIN